MKSGRKPRVLCLDDEPQVLEALSDALRRKFDVVVTSNGFEALRLLTADPFEVVLADMRMPMLNGDRFFNLAREHSPDTTRVLLTGHSGLPDAAAAVNEGEIFRLLIKPCKTADLVHTLDAAIAHHHARVAQRTALDHTAEATVSALIELAQQIDPDSASRADRVRRHATDLFAHANDGRSPRPELLRACQLMQLGVASVSAETRARTASGARLAPEHAAELEELPALAARVMPDVATLQPVRRLLAATGQPNAASRPQSSTADGDAQVLRIALDFELQLRQGTPMETAVRALRVRSGRYDARLLRAFAELMEFT
jgi:CheY-like chemotaxis protein